MKRVTALAPWALGGLCMGFAVANLVVGLIDSSWVSFAVAGWCFTVGSFNIIGGIHASRRVHRDHRSADPGSHPQLGTYVAESDHGTEPIEGAGTRVVDEPIRAWKVAGASLHKDGSVTFDGYGGLYGVEAEAECRAGGRHVAPDPSCTCGFYALKEPPQPHGAQALLEVELYGRVLHYADGYRAQHQRVLSVTTRPTCAETVNTPNGYTYTCARKAAFTADSRFYCAEHALAQRRRFYEFKAEPVNCETEWRWAS